MESTETIPPSKYQILVEFALRHRDFCMPELESVLDMNGLRVNEHIEIVDLPGHSQTKRPFVLLSMDSHASFVSDIATMILSRCTLVRSVLEVWGAAPQSLQDCAQRMAQWILHPPGSLVYKRVQSASWKLTVHTLGTTFSRDVQNEMRACIMEPLEFTGRVQMERPDQEFVLIREVEMQDEGGPVYPRVDKNGNIVPENDRRPPLALYFGRALGGQGRNLRRMNGKMNDYNLKVRKYLGPTSMDAELSFIMTNLAQARPSKIAFDPFVGTGSILLSCAVRGAYCIGTDIDIRVLKGKSQQQTIWSNFAQFNLPRPEIIRSDNGIYHRHFINSVAVYDCIVTDPPYGIRAGARKSGSRRETVRDILPEHRHDHIAQTQPYPVSDVMADLLDVAARVLVNGGRLVYIIPAMAHDFDPEADLPQHPCLELVHVCFQPLSSEYGRRMVAMKKTKDYDPDQRAEYLKAIWKYGPESANKCADLREKIMEAAKKKPNYEEKAAHRKEKRKRHRQEKKAAKRRSREEAETQGNASS